MVVEEIHLYLKYVSNSTKLLFYPSCLRIFFSKDTSNYFDDDLSLFSHPCLFFMCKFNANEEAYSFLQFEL